MVLFNLINNFNRQSADFIIDKAVDIIVIVVIGFLAIRLINFLLGKLFDKTDFNKGVEQFIQSFIVGLLWILLILTVLSYTGIDIGPILASLSIAGFITGFALKDVLANLAAGLLILAVRPFTIGDYIRSGDLEGTVERIGIASCVMRRGDNVKVVMPNGLLWGRAIFNYTDHRIRRFEIQIIAKNDSSTGKISRLLTQALSDNPLVLKEPEPMVYYSNIGSSIALNIRGWTNSGAYDDAIIQLSNRIKELFDKNDVQL